MNEVGVYGVAPIPILVAALALCVGTPCVAQHSSWAEYRPEHYLTGQGRSTDPDAQERLAEAESGALAALSRSIRTHVTSTFETLRREDPEKYEEVTHVHNSATSRIEVIGIEPLLLHEEGDTLYAFAYMSREKAKRDHYALAESLAEEIHEKLDTATRFAHDNRRRDALRTYSEAYPLLARLEDALAVLLVVGGAPPDIPFSRPGIEEQVANLEDAPVYSLADAAQLLIERLERSGELGARVHTKPFTYARSDFASPFSHHLHQLMDSQLGARSIEGTRSFRPKGVDYALEAGRQSNATTALFGTYQEVGDAVYMYARAMDVESGLRVAAADVAIPKTLVVQSNLELKPQNFLQALADSRLGSEPRKPLHFTG